MLFRGGSFVFGANASAILTFLAALDNDDDDDDGGRKSDGANDGPYSACARGPEQPRTDWTAWSSRQTTTRTRRRPGMRNCPRLSDWATMRRAMTR